VLAQVLNAFEEGNGFDTADVDDVLMGCFAGSGHHSMDTHVCRRSTLPSRASTPSRPLASSGRDAPRGAGRTRDESPPGRAPEGLLETAIGQFAAGAEREPELAG
jgi:hypothetical protein